jgi:hypothetical protein
MKTSSRIAWTLWALVPVGMLAFHFGPGQAIHREEQASRLVARASSLEEIALASQERAYAAHLAAVAARMAAFGTDDAALREAATRATEAEDAAYASAGADWKAAATALAEAETALADEGGLRNAEIRVARARAIVRSGDVGVGAELLESVLETGLATEPSADAASDPKDAAARETLARAAREELATAYYYGARLMRLAGKPSEEWREVSALARQHFRALAEQANADEAADDAARHERNVELVLNLEQSSLDELYGKPSPRDCPGGQCNGMGKRPGKKPGKRPGNGEQPSKGAGMGGDIGTGW